MGSQTPDHGGAVPTGDDREAEEAARTFYERLRESGQLVDADADADLSTLSPRITHVRYPDGRVERVGFS